MQAKLRKTMCRRDDVSIFGRSAATLLSQLLYWTERSKNDGWVHKTNAQWQEETSLSRWQVVFALKLLRDARVIETTVGKSHVGRTNFLRVDRVQLAALREGGSVGNQPTPSVGNQPTHRLETNLPPGFTPYIGFRVHTESTGLAQKNMREAAEEDLKSNPLQAGQEDEEMNQYGKKTRKDRTIGKAENIFSTLKKQQVADVAPIGRHVTPKTLGDLWQKWSAKYNPDTLPFAPCLTMAQMGALRRPILVWKAAHQDPNAVLKAVLRDWYGFTKHVQALQDLKSVPQAPSVPFAVKWCNEALSFYMKSGEKVLEAVVAMKQEAPASAAGVAVQKIAEKSKKLPEPEPEMTLEELLAMEKQWEEEERQAKGAA